MVAMSSGVLAGVTQLGTSSNVGMAQAVKAQEAIKNIAKAGVS